jgi:hypothetical protein
VATVVVVLMILFAVLVAVSVFVPDVSRRAAMPQ